MSKNILIGVGALILIGIIAFILVKPSSNSNSSTSPSQISTGKTYTASEIAAHKDATSCWSSINGKVYDLTAWVNQHPGGVENILSICGSDGSDAFNGQHSGQGKPENIMQTYYIGDLKTQ